MAAALALAGCVSPAPAAPPEYPQQAAPAAVADDPINNVDLAYLRRTAGGVLAALVTALPPASQARVQNIPFFADSTVGEVNAYAACKSHVPYMAMTDGLLQIQAYIAQLRAADEVFGSQKLDGYLRLLAQYQKPRQPVVTPPMGYVDAAQVVDPRKVARQHQLLEEQIAFVLGHELAHHYLGHTGCAVGDGGGGITVADLGRLASRVAPFVNQPNEVMADMAGVNNMLTAGATRPGYRWTEQGALLTLDFFSRLQQLTPEAILFSFEDSHPNPALRVPFIHQAAATWRKNGGR